MATLGLGRLGNLVAGLALIAGCYQQSSAGYSTIPEPEPEPVTVAGPPGGGMDPQYQPGYVDDNASGGGAEYTDPTGEPSADPSDEQNGTYVMGQVTDGEIDATLDGYGEWVDVDGYGQVWRPYTTVVGVDFTPYETCGSWVWTDWGWTYACDWDWGWLPFHYGRWGWFDDYWAWVPDYEWSPAWVEWRGGGGYTGWRPLAPIVRDHRGGHTGGAGGAGGVIVHDHRHGTGPIIHDHRSAHTKDWQWRFAANTELGKPHIRAHLMKSLAEGIRVTQTLPRPSFHPNMQPVKAEGLMRGRLAVAAQLRAGASPGNGAVMTVGGRGAVGTTAPRGGTTDWRGGAGATRPLPSSTDVDTSSVYAPTYPTYQPPRHSYPANNGGTAQPATANPTYGGLPVEPTTPTPTPPDTHPTAPTYPAQTEPTRTPEPTQPTWTHPSAPVYTPTNPPVTTSPGQPTWTHPSAPIYTPTQPPTTRAPDRYTPPTYTPSTPTYTPPRYNPPTYTPSAPTYSPPRYNPPTYTPAPVHSAPGRRAEYTPTYPSRTYASAYSPPARTYTYSPTRSYSPPARSYSPPARSYSPPARTYTSSYSAPSRSFSAPSRSYTSSYSAPSHSYSAPSHSFSAPSHSSSFSSHSSSFSSHSFSGGGGGHSFSSGGGGHSFSGGGHSGGGHHR
jgi:hypothetical protein